MVLLPFHGLIRYKNDIMSYTEAVCFFEKHEMENALEILNRLIIQNQADIKVLLLRGRIFYKMQRWGDAMNDFNAVLDLDSNNQEAQAGIEMAKNILGYFNPEMFNP